MQNIFYFSYVYYASFAKTMLVKVEIAVGLQASYQ